MTDYTPLTAIDKERFRLRCYTTIRPGACMDCCRGQARCDCRCCRGRCSCDCHKPHGKQEVSDELGLRLLVDLEASRELLRTIAKELYILQCLNVPDMETMRKTIRQIAALIRKEAGL